MSNDETNRRKEIIEKLAMVALTVALTAAVLILYFGPIAYYLSTPFEDIEQQQAALDNSGYNWTEVNYTTFETKVDCGFLCTSTVAEEQCANGIQEACDYVTIKNVDYHDRNGFEDDLREFGGWICTINILVLALTSPIWAYYLLLFLANIVGRSN